MNPANIPIACPYRYYSAQELYELLNKFQPSPYKKDNRPTLTIKQLLPHLTTEQKAGLLEIYAQIGHD